MFHFESKIYEIENEDEEEVNSNGPIFHEDVHRSSHIFHFYVHQFLGPSPQIFLRRVQI
jgi:hypothetical protein